MSEISYAGGLSIEQVRSQVKAEKIYKMSSNENPHGPSPRVLAAISAAAGELHLYPPNQNDEFHAFLAAFHGRGVTTGHIFSAVSGVEVLELIARTLLNPGDEALICPPTFGWYVRSVEREGGIVRTVPLQEGSFAHDIDAMLAAITPRTKLVYLCNPHNPTGTMLPAAEMARLVENLPPQVILIADEVYHHFVTAVDYPDTLPLVLAGHQIIMIQSFSKAYGLAGLRLGYGITTPEIAAQLVARRRPFQLSRLALAAGRAAINDQEHLQRSVGAILDGRDYLETELERLGITYWPSQTNFLLLRPPVEAAQLYQQLLEAGIMVRPTLKNGLPGHIRVTIGLPEANAAFIQTLESILAQEN